MQFDPENKIVQLCAKGIELEGPDTKDKAHELYTEAWNEAGNDLEKFISAHYLARVQNSVQDKLYWDEQALNYALKLEDEGMKGTLPSLYLNIAKGYEDLQENEKAIKYYNEALFFTSHLPEDGYGKMIRSGIENGLKRISL